MISRQYVVRQSYLVKCVAYLVLAVHGMVAVGCASSPPEPGRTSDPEPAPGVIRRDIAALERAKYTHQACDADHDCPAGSHCDGDTRTCEWECLADSDCGRGKACDALGVCVSRPAVPYMSNALPACMALDASVKRQVLLGDHGDGVNGINDQQLPCMAGPDNPDDDCPCGSYCAGEAGTCRVDCVSENPPPGFACGAGQTCSVTGKCVASTAPASGPPLDVTLEIAPQSVTVNTALAASSLIPVTVYVTANSLDFLTSGAANPAKVTYSFVPVGGPDGTVPTGPDPLVTCAADHAGPLTATCTFAGGWTFAPSSTTLRSLPRTIWVQVPQATAPRQWLLTARSDLAAAPATAAIVTTPVVQPATDPGHYTGTIRWANAGAVTAEATLELPIEAIVTASHVAVFEPTHVLLPDGHAVLSRDNSKVTMLGWLDSPVSGAAARYDVQLHLGALTYDATTGHLGGTVSLSTGSGSGATALALALALDRTGDATAAACASSANTCGAGTYCDPVMNVCLAGAGPAAGRGIVGVLDTASLPSTVLASAALASWAPVVTTLANNNSSLLGGTGLTGISRAYCYQPGESLAAHFGTSGIQRPGPSLDFGCMQGSVQGTAEYDQTTFRFETRTTEVQLNSSSAQTFNLLDACRADLAVHPQGVPTLANTLSSTSPCANLAQFFLAMNANVRSGASATLTVAQMRMATQLLRQWLGVHAYVANSSIQNRQFDDALGTATSAADIDLGQAVDLMDQGLRVLLDPAIRPQFADGEWATVAVAPDYRVHDRPVARWSFNQMAGAEFNPPSDGTIPFDVLGVDTTWNVLLTTGSAAPICKSTQPIGVADTTFTIVFYMGHPILGGGPVRVFEKIASDGSRVWVEVNPISATQLNVALKDSRGGIATFPPISSVVMPNGFSEWGLLGFIVDGASYRLVQALPGALNVLPASNITAAGGPRWGTSGPVQLGCSLPSSCQRGSCTSWDLNTAGDAGDISYSSRTETAWTLSKTCKGFSCTGPGTQAQCDASASARRQELVSQLLPGAPASAVARLVVTGTRTETKETDDPSSGIVTTVTDVCRLAITNQPVPGTRVKPVCNCLAASPPWAPQGLFYDELSLWNRPLDPEELATLAGTYNYFSANETLPPKTATPPGNEQATGLAAHLLEAAGADLNLLAGYVNAARDASYGECYLSNASATRDAARDRAGRNLRLVAVIEAEAARLASAAGATSAPWYPRYQADRKLVAANRGKVVQELQLLSQCKNTLNISEEELPLFVGQVSGGPARFFASTNYLAGLANGPNGPIPMAVAALGDAQSAYNAQVTADFTQVLTATDQQQIVERLKVTYDGELRRYCGAPASGPRLVDRFLAGTLDASNCYIKTEQSGCQGLAGTPLTAVPASCLRGEIGERLVALQSAAVDATSAKNGLDRATAQYDADMAYCGRRQEALHEAEKILAKHYKHMEYLRAQQATGDNLLNIVTGILHVDPTTIVHSVSDLARNFGISLGHPTNTLQEQLEAERNDEVMQARSHDLDIADCYHKVDDEKFAIDAARDVINRAAQQTSAALFALQDAKDTLTALANEAAGQLDLQAAIGLARTPPHLHYWLDNRIETYRREMAFARRLTYLAVRAFEYENQESSNLRGTVLTARRPDDLRAVIEFMNRVTAPLSGTFDASADQLPVVLSLRDELMHLENLAGKLHLPPGVPPVSAEVLFGQILASDSAKIYKPDGTLLGHGIRFSVRPDFWSASICAERTWRVVPLVQHGLPNGLPDHPELLLIQNNAFGSQLCRGAVGDVAITRAGAASNLVTDDASARFQPPAPSMSMLLGMPPTSVISRQQLAHDLPIGDASPFAGRGLFGDYILVFPADPNPCARNLASCSGWSDDTLAIVKDVLLRFEVVEATRQAR